MNNLPTHDVPILDDDVDLSYNDDLAQLLDFVDDSELDFFHIEQEN
jgi:hypothetical protein